MESAWKARWCLEVATVQRVQSCHCGNARNKRHENPRGRVFYAQSLAPVARVVTLVHHGASRALYVFLKFTDSVGFDDAQQVWSWNRMFIFTN